MAVYLEPKIILYPPWYSCYSRDYTWRSSFFLFFSFPVSVLLPPRLREEVFLGLELPNALGHRKPTEVCNRSLKLEAETKKMAKTSNLGAPTRARIMRYIPKKEALS
ncbi:hypothetical protein BDV23DRAFT_32824 [Aspergillus alliaceus]|uniref:Uncharacterized protein n=1 Tax=Petromyces alliaceus TaxID=209559 RepID=A0A5N7CJI8_PETAA|nr:hypothetical protein BDV23DRAFT_32824 [Aspergillus alliaceus]